MKLFLPPDQLLGLYFHIPFCLSRCGYCDFAVYTDQDDHQDQYVLRLCHEIRFWSQNNSTRKIGALYFGGGTPSRLSPLYWKVLFQSINQYFHLSENIEVTCEANPESLTPDLLKLWRDLGINRISLGVQSLNDRILRQIDRTHDSRTAIQSIETILQSGITNWSVDLIYGLPGQSLDNWLGDLKEICSFAPPHLSFYNLILHPNLPVSRKMKSIPEAAQDELSAIMFLEGISYLHTQHYNIYELSNACHEGFPCRHNWLYWTGGEWIGMGLSGSSFYQNTYFRNPSSWHAYMTMWKEIPKTIPVQIEASDHDSALLDFIMLRLRTADGFWVHDCQSLYGMKLPDRFHQEHATMIRHGLCKPTERQVALTPQGWLLHSEITNRLYHTLKSTRPDTTQ